MQVKYAGIALTGPTVFEQTGNVGFPIARSVYKQQGIRRDEIYMRPMGNKMRTVSLTCWRSFPNILVAMDARADFIDSLPEEGELILRQEALGGFVQQVGYACIESTPEPLLLGRSVQFTFVFTVTGLRSSVAPPTARLTEEGLIRITEDGQVRITE